MKLKCKTGLYLILSVTALYPAVFLNELMIDPVYSENSAEYVEIVNKGEMTINLSGWLFGDAQDMDALICPDDSLLLPGAYAVILDPDYESEYDDDIPDSVLRVTIEDSRFGAYGLSNNTSKLYYLMSPEEIILDSCLSFAGMPEGYSMERDDEGVWQVSVRYGGTPGYVNSVCRPESPFLSLEPLNSFRKGTEIIADLNIFNAGRLPVSTFELSLTDSLTGRQLFSEHIRAEIKGGDSLLISTVWPAPLYGKHIVVWELHYENSSRSGSYEHTITVPPDSLFLTEFCAIPGDGISCEFIEIFNMSSLPVNLAEMTITDKTGTADLVDGDLVLPELGLGVAAEKPEFRDDVQSPFFMWVPPAWRALNNNGDLILWKDSEGNILDMLEYDTSWPVNAGTGLERKSILFSADRVDNWQRGFSPGSPNSAMWPDTLFFIDNFEFSPSPPELRFRIKNFGEKKLPETELCLYLDMEGTGMPLDVNKLSTVSIPSLEINDSSDVIFYPTLICAGYLTFLIQLPSLSDTVFFFESLYPWPGKSLVINEYCPWPGEMHGSEYFELFVTGDYTLNLKGFGFSDRTGSVTWPECLILHPGDYVVFAKNTEIHHYFPDAGAIIPEAWRSLNNGEDCLVITCPNGKMQDSIVYDHSDEDLPYQRYSPFLPSTLEMNWIEKSPGTPGMPNPFSPSDIEWYTRLSLKDRKNGKVELYISLVNKGCTAGTAPPFLIKVSHPGGRTESISELRIDTFLNPGESLMDSVAVYRDKPGTAQWFLEGTHVVSDTLEIYIPYDRSPVTLNEVMNCPESSDPAEWIELHATEVPLLVRNWYLGVDDKSLPFSADFYEEYPVLSHEKWCESHQYIPVEGFPALVNKGFILRLFDSDSILMDSADLRNHSEFTTGVSLEKPAQGHPFLSGISWKRSRSAFGHTAGRVNSIFVHQTGEKLITIEPRILSRLSDEPMCITVSSDKGLAYAEIHILTATGNPVRNYKKNAFSSPLVQVFWDGTFTDGSLVPAGIYLVFTKIRCSDGTKKEELGSVMVNFP
jgi:hypothetical protein